MTEDELQRKRAEFRDQEVGKKITQFNQIEEYRQQALKSNYTSKRVDRRLGKMGWTIVGTQATFLVFFGTLLIFSYIPHTRNIVTMIMP